MSDTLDMRARVAANLAAARARLASAATRAGRSPDDVRLIAVSKTFDAEHVRAAYEAGQRDFGENKVQEALAKRDETADLDITWHLIGHLQSNKARRTGGAFGWIHSVDSVDLLRRIDRAASEAGSRPRLLLQVDLAGETTKFGAPLADVRPLLDAAAACEAAVMTGLMLLPPWNDDAEASRPWFRRLRDLRDTLLAEGRPASMLAQLSMGMSHDCEVAVEEGATMVRIGTAIFGTRAPAA
jgi:pyridoxal phosphate enzyme (YggS family)